MGSLSRHCGILISIICFVAYLIFDLIMHEKMFESNEAVALTLQSGSNPFFDIVMYTFSFFVYEQAISLFFIIFYVLYANKFQILKIMIYTSLATYVLSAVKMIHHDPRPYMVYDRITGKGCDREFGNPSGHAFISSLFYLMLWDTFKNRKFEFQAASATSLIKSAIDSGQNIVITEESEPESRTKKFKYLLALALVFIFGVGFSRVYLGVHSYNQILLGYSFGFFSLSVYFCEVEDQLDSFLSKLAHKIFYDRRDFIKYGIFILLAYVILVTISIVIFEILRASFDVPQAWITNIISDCKEYVYYKSMHYKCLMDTGIVSLAFGIFFGLLFTQGEYEPEKYDIEYIKLPITQKIYRLLVMITPLGLIFLILEVIPMGEYIYLLFFFKSCLRLFLMGFLLVKAMPFLFHKFKIDIEGDFLRYTGKTDTLKYREENKDRVIGIPLIKEDEI